MATMDKDNKDDEFTSSGIEDTLEEFYSELKEHIKKLGLDLDLILSKEDEIRQYLLENIGEPHLGYDKKTIVEFVPTAIKAVRIYKDVVEELYKESEIVRNMNEEEWEKYRRGIKWSQGARADDIKREGDGVASLLFEALDFKYLGIKVEGKPLIDTMEKAPVVKNVVNDYSISQNYSELDMRMGNVKGHNYLDQFTLIKNTEN